MKSLTYELFDFQTPETLGERIWFRLLELFIIFYTLQFSWEWGLYIQEIGAVLLPLGIAGYVDVSFMFDNGLSVVNAGLITVFCVMGFTRIWRYGYLGAVLLLHLQYASRYCLGEISHGSNLIGMSLLGLGLGAIFFHERITRRRFTLGFLYFSLGLGYTSAALCKLIGTGITWPDGRHLWLWIAERQADTFSKFGTAELNGLQEWILIEPAIGTVVLSFGLLTELFGILMWWRRFRYLIIPALIGMHYGIALTMQIFFQAYTYELMFLALPWPLLIDKLLDRVAGRSLLERFRGTALARSL